MIQSNRRLRQAIKLCGNRQHKGTPNNLPKQCHIVAKYLSYSPLGNRPPIGIWNLENAEFILKSFNKKTNFENTVFRAASK